MELYELEAEAQDICQHWVRKIGIGFHIDTPASDYSPPLPINDRRALHADLRRLWQIGELTGLDMYGIALDAMEELCVS
jgi:hypothetical protein